MKARVLLLLGVAVLTIRCGGADSPRGAGQPPAPAIADGARSAPTPTAPRGSVAVFAAASLTDAFTEIGALLPRTYPGLSVTFNFAASTALRTQIEQGARADVYASADEAQMSLAQRAGLIEGEPRVFAKNKLVVITPRGSAAGISQIQDLARPGVKLVLTDRNVPIGAYARTALEKMAADARFGPNFARRVLANVRSEEANVRAVVTKVQLGEADAAIVYATDVTPAVSKDLHSIAIADEFNLVAAYPIAVVEGAPNRAAARAFVDFVRSPAGQEVLKRHGFIVDRETGAGGSFMDETPVAVAASTRR